MEVVTQALPKSGDCSIYATDLVEGRLEVARRLGARWAGNPRSTNIVAAMAPQNMIAYLRDNTLIITPGDRVDIPAQNTGGVSGVITVTVQLCDRQEGIQDENPQYILLAPDNTK